MPLALATALFETRRWASVNAVGWPFAAAVLFAALAVSVGAHTAYDGLIQHCEANLLAPPTLITPLATIAFGCG